MLVRVGMIIKDNERNSIDNDFNETNSNKDREL